MKEGDKLKRDTDGRLFEVTFLSHWSDLCSVVDGQPIEKYSAKWLGGNQLVGSAGPTFTLLKEDGTPADVV